MANKKFSQFSSNPISSTGFFVGYDSLSNDNIKFSVVPVTNGGTGADNVGDALNTLTSSASYLDNNILTTNSGVAGFSDAWNIPTIPKQVVMLFQAAVGGVSLPNGISTLVPMNAALTVKSNSPFASPTITAGGNVLIPPTMYGYWKVTMNIIIQTDGLTNLSRVQASIYNVTGSAVKKLLIDEEVTLAVSDVAVSSNTGILFINGTTDELGMEITVNGSSFVTYSQDNLFCEMIFEYLGS
jgi:hypothetical protein